MNILVAVERMNGFNHPSSSITLAIRNVAIKVMGAYPKYGIARIQEIKIMPKNVFAS